MPVECATVQAKLEAGLSAAEKSKLDHPVAAQLWQAIVGRIAGGSTGTKLVGSPDFCYSPDGTQLNGSATFSDEAGTFRVCIIEATLDLDGTAKPTQIDVFETQDKYVAYAHESDAASEWRLNRGFRPLM